MNRLRQLIHEMRDLLEMDSANVGAYVRPLGPMLPPEPLPGYEDAVDILAPRRRKQLDSRPDKKKSKE